MRYSLDEEERVERRMRGEPADNSGDGKGLARWCVVAVLIVVGCGALVWGW